MPPRATFSAPLTIAVTLVGAAAFLAFFALQAFAPSLRGPPAGPNAASPSAVGFAAIVRLLRALETPVIASRRTPDWEDTPPSLVVLTPQAPAESPLAAFAVAPILVVLPKWDVAEDPERPVWVRRFGVLSEEGVLFAAPQEFGAMALRREAGFAPAQLYAANRLFGQNAGVSVMETPEGWRANVDPLMATALLPAGRIENLQTLSGPGLLPMLVTARGEIVLAEVQGLGLGQPVYVLSDPDYLNNLGLAEADRARSAVAMLEPLRARSGAAIAFDLTEHGMGREPSLLRLALEPPFVWATLCALAAVALVGWQAAARFGPELRPERAIALGKRALADNTAALVRLAGREARMGAGYADLTRATVARALGLSRAVQNEALDAAIAKAAPTNAPGEAFPALAAEARAAADRTSLLAAARKLHRWRREMNRAAS